MGYMEQIFKFLKKVVEKVIQNDLLTYANSLSFRLILAIFPFIIAVLTLFGFFNLPTDNIIAMVIRFVPGDVGQMISSFIAEVIGEKRISLFSTSLLIAVYTASTGFYTMIKGICQSYINKNLDFVKARLMSVLLMFVFVVSIVATLYVIIFGDAINRMLINFRIIKHIPHIFNGMLINIANMFVMFFFLVVLYKSSIGIRTRIRDILPGIFFTLGGWLIVSKLFNIYVNNFSRYSVIYGSIGTLFVFALWLYLLSCVILIGAQINAEYRAVIRAKKFAENTEQGQDNNI